MSAMKQTGIAIAGLGTVGMGVVANLQRNASLIATRCGFTFPIRAVAVRNPNKPRPALPSSAILTTDPLSLPERPDVQIVVELMGGEQPALALAEKTLRLGKAFVTANKAMLAMHGDHLCRLAQQYRAPLCFEASVAGGIPILKALREGFSANHILSISGIVNGTCNYILSAMSSGGSSFAEALQQAQAQGYAEADPTLDIDGLDAMHKAVILSALAYGSWPDPSAVYVRGIRNIHTEDIHFSALLGYTVKLLATVRLAPNRKVELHVQPTLIPSRHILASVQSSFNALVLRGDIVGETVFIGRGAGADPTSSAVLADLVEAATKISSIHPSPPAPLPQGRCEVLPYGETRSQFYLRFNVLDKPGTLARIAEVLGRHDIGISSALQPPGNYGTQVPLILILHDALQNNLSLALQEIASLGITKEPTVTYRVEQFLQPPTPSPLPQPAKTQFVFCN